VKSGSVANLPRLLVAGLVCTFLVPQTRESGALVRVERSFRRQDRASDVHAAKTVLRAVQAVSSRASPPDLNDVRDQFELDYLLLGMSGREFRIRGQLLEKRQTGRRVRYAYTFPANLETGHGRSKPTQETSEVRIRRRGERTS
jgi:hypothetical protein